MSKQSVWQGVDDCPYEKRWDLAKNSTIGCGGYAPIAYFPQSVEALIAILLRIQVERAPYYIVGKMSNVLPKDGVSHRVFVCTKDVKEINAHSGFFACGVTSSAFLRACREAQKSGGEFLEGIPCTLGGALYMNAGVAGAYMQSIVDRVLVLADGQAKELSVAECAFAYKTSVFMQKSLPILGAWFRLEDSTKAQIDERIALYRSRRVHLPKGRSMGCVFQNPVDGFAGRYIEGAGLKGLRFGGAIVSDVHANFILNVDGATGAQIQTLVTMVKNAVFAQYKIELKEEIKYLE